MKTKSMTAALAAIALVSALWIYERQLVAREKHVLALQEMEAARLRQQLAGLDREHRAAARLAADLARELAAETEKFGESELSPETRTEGQDWLARRQRLNELFERQPAQRTPELQLLSELDWLELARTIPADSGERFARFMVRDFANASFFVLLQKALRDYTRQSNRAPLTDPAQLQPFFRPPIDPAILARYEIVPDAQIGRPTPQLTIVERAPIDPDYDLRRTLKVNGSYSSSGLWSIEPIRKATNDAYAAYFAANKSLSSNSSDFLPYTTDPFARAIFEAMAAYEKDHDGKSSSLPSNLLPYVTVPEFRTAVEKMARARREP